MKDMENLVLDLLEMLRAHQIREDIDTFEKDPETENDHQS